MLVIAACIALVAVGVVLVARWGGLRSEPRRGWAGYGAVALAAGMTAVAIHGHAATVRELLARGADTRIEDPEHHATPLGWAEFGREVSIEPGGDYEAAIAALSADTPPEPRRRR